MVGIYTIDDCCKARQGNDGSGSRGTNESVGQRCLQEMVRMYRLSITAHVNI